MGDILKEAIADAKAVRETALQNAKMALEEAFTPQLKSMLSAKLKEDEFGGDEEEVAIAPEEDEEFGGEEEIPAEEPVVAPEEDEEVGVEDDTLDLESIIRELEAELGDEEEPVAEQDDAYDDKVGKTDASHLAEEDDAYAENDPGEKPEHVGGTIGEGEDEEEIDID